MKVWLVALLVAVLGVGTVTQAQGYRLMFKDTAGATRTYANTIKLSGTVDAMGTKVPIAGTVTFDLVERVTGVNPDGSANIETKLQDGQVQVTITGLPGQQEAQTITQPIPPVTITYTRTPQGAVSNLKTEGELAVLPGIPADLLNSLQMPGQGLTFPDRELQIGDSWAGEITAEIAPGQDVALAATYQLAGVEQVAGMEYLQLLTTATANLDNVVITTDQLPGQPETKLNMDLNLALNATTLFDAMAGNVYRTTFSGDARVSLMPVNGSPEMAITADLRLEGSMQRQ